MALEDLTKGPHGIDVVAILWPTTGVLMLLALPYINPKPLTLNPKPLNSLTLNPKPLNPKLYPLILDPHEAAQVCWFLFQHSHAAQLFAISGGAAGAPAFRGGGRCWGWVKELGIRV